MVYGKFVQRCAPGALVTRDLDGHRGMIVAAQQPIWDREHNHLVNWRFEILIDQVLVITEHFGSQFSLVQTW